MLVSLPIKNNDKCINIVFQVVYIDCKYIIRPYNVNNLYHVIAWSESYGINTILIHFPLILTAINNILYCDLFYIIETLSNRNDFFSNLINSINSYYNKQYILNQGTSSLNEEYLKHTTLASYINVDNLINSIYYTTNQYLNTCLYYIKTNTTTLSETLNNIIKAISLIEIQFYGNRKSIHEHIIYIKNYKNDTKWSKFITIHNLIAHLILYEYTKIIEITVNELYQPLYCKLLLAIYTNNDLLVLKQLKTHVKIIEPKYIQYISDIPNDITFDKFKEIINTQSKFNIDTLNNLLNNYVYPLNYNKKTLNLSFAKILFYSFKYYNDILNELQERRDNEETGSKHNLHINSKIKLTYIFILKIYKAIDMQDTSMYFNTRVYTDTLVNIIMKILLFNDNYNLFSGLTSKINKYQKIFIENTIIITILSNLTWKSISKQIILLKYIIDAKQTNGMLFIVDGKINKNINNSMDYRLKKIITDPLLMFSYLKKETDYYKWTITFKETIGKIFYNPIILKTEDYVKLSKLIYLLSKITVQNLENPEYNKLINFLNKNTRIILFNERINIKIKDLFKNNNLNFGFLAKHINDYEQSTISITEVDDKEQLDKLTRKYYKYKGRYLGMKYSDKL